MRSSFVWIALSLIAVAFTWHVVSWSEQYGKLAVPPDYDDSITMVEAGFRTLTYQQDGWGAMFNHSANRNPRSFFHIYWTAFLYALFGIHESVAFYASCVFLFGALLAFVFLLPKEISYLWKFAWVLVFLQIPICFHIIHDYRSEIAMAAFLFIGCACALEWIWGNSREKLWFFLTAISFLLALGMKPVMFPYQLGMLGLCSLVYLTKQLAEYKPSQGIRPVRSWFFRLLLLWAMVIIPLVPHFLIHWHSIREYIVGNSFETKFWNFTEEQGSQYLFHWLGYSGVWYVGALNGIFGFLILAGLVCSLVPGLKVYSPGGKWLSVVFITIGSYAGISISPMHQPFWGLTFNLLLSSTAICYLAFLFNTRKFGLVISTLFVAALGTMWLYIPVNQILICLICFCLLLGGWLVIAQKQSRYAVVMAVLLSSFVFLYAYSVKGVMFQFAVLALLLPLFAAVFRFPRKQWVPFACTGMLALIVWTVIKPAPYHNYVERTIHEAGEGGLEWRRNGPRLVYESIQNDWNGSGSPSIWCSAFGWVDAKTISWEAIKKGRPWYVETLAGSYAENSKTIIPGIIPENADYLVMPSLGITGEIKMPSTCFDMNPAARSNNRFQLLSEIKAPQGFIGIYKKNRTPL
jgi:hypothetical protein